MTEVWQTGASHTEAPNVYETTPFGAPVARACSRWLTPKDVASRLHVCRATVYKLCEVGRLGHVRVGLTIRISERDLDTFLATSRARPTP